MRKLFSTLAISAAVIAFISGTSMAASSFLGTTGGILTPNDQLLAVGAYDASYHVIQVDSGDSTSNVVGVNIGLTPDLEVGAGYVSSNAANADSQAILNAKYRVLAETPKQPAIVVGVIDIAGQLDADPNKQPSLYAVIGKNLTSVASDMMDEPVRPLRGYMGVGTGIYNGLFFGLDYSVSPRANVVAEYINEFNAKNIFSKRSVFNLGLRVAITENLRGDIAWVKGNDLGFGISYTKIGF